MVKLNLQLFAEGEAAAPAAESAGQTAVSAGGPLQAGDTLADGTQIQSNRVAAEMERQMKRHPELKGAYSRAGRAPAGTQADAQAGPPEAAQGAPADDVQRRWEEAKKGEFAALYGADVKKAVQERFKNQDDIKGQLDMLEPALKVLRERAGVESNEDLVNQIMDDDSLYEEAASEAGMTVAAYKNFLKFKAEHDQHEAEREELQFRETVQKHYQNLANQAEALKQQFPGLDINQELQNEQFRRLTAPDIGMSVEDAYFAVHHKELAPQMMAYGMQRARGQMAQTIMANGQRPREGGLGTQQNAAADMKLDPRSMTRKERDAIRNRIHAGRERITFD